jgi:hypothetical protein
MPAEARTAQAQFYSLEQEKAEISRYNRVTDLAAVVVEEATTEAAVAETEVTLITGVAQEVVEALAT